MTWYAAFVVVRGRHAPLRLAVAPLVFTLAASCVHYTVASNPADKPSPARSYFYGRFHIDARRATKTMDGHQTMGFVIRCTDGSEYTIRFTRERRVQVIAANPAQCALAAIVFTHADDTIAARADLRQSPLGGFVLAPGNAYYLGDYFAQSTVKSTWMVVGTWIESDWVLTAADDDYAATSAELKRTFVHFAGLPTENRMLIGSKRVPSDAVKRAFVASDGSEDVVSPERATRLAGLTKRRYATPAACEAACPRNGHCFPFRGDDGPAMTCVVRCNSDKECPDGLVCNCPADDAVACRAVATTPNDPMAGICVSVEPAGERR